MLRVCPTCNNTVEATAYAAHRQAHEKARGSWSKGRDRSAQAKFRILVLARAGYRCQYIYPEHEPGKYEPKSPHPQRGQRCIATTALQAHHLEPGNDDPSKGQALCTYHHRLVDSHAR